MQTIIESKYTRGEWHHQAGLIVSKSGVVAMLPTGAGCVRAVNNPNESQANMRLLSAAPDLLAALHAIMNDCREVAEGREPPTPEFWHSILNGKARAAIAKAEGR